MAVTIAIRLPLGRYHATPWDRSVNEGAVEWPPSPWRLLRALVATWHTRWPDLPASTFDGLLDSLGGPPSYLTPKAWPAHTRHYMPDLSHRKGESGRTDLTHDPFQWVPRDADLLVRWEADLDPEQRAVLAKLAELLPYLGRADSVCEARLLDTDPVPHGAWWRPDAGGAHSARLLAPSIPVARTALEMTTTEIRKSRRTMPPGTNWVEYGCTPHREPEAKNLARSRITDVQAIRFAVVSRAPTKAANGILLADAVHMQAAHLLAECGGADLLAGDGAATGHQHAHWIPVSGGVGPDARVGAVIVYAPRGFRPADVSALVRLRKVSGRIGGGNREGYDVRGLPKADLLLQAVGPIAQVAPELCGPARHWHSRTPYLPVRHRKREALLDYLTADVAAELRYRNMPAATVSLVDDEGIPDRWSRGYRRYRLAERMNKARPGVGLRLEFGSDVSGPLLLGQLSHFGYGIFVPDRSR
jgi:CRISPR-associated protein Csb2